MKERKFLVTFCLEDDADLLAEDVEKMIESEMMHGCTFWGDEYGGIISYGAEEVKEDE